MTQLVKMQLVMWTKT